MFYLSVSLSPAFLPGPCASFFAFLSFSGFSISFSLATLFLPHSHLASHLCPFRVILLINFLIFSCLSVSLLPRPLSASGLPRNDFINSLWYPVKELYVNISSILPAWLYMVAFMWKKSNYETKPKKPIINKFPVEMHLLHNEVECLILSCVLSVPSHIITVPTCHLSIKVRLRCGFLILT